MAEGNSNQHDATRMCYACRLVEIDLTAAAEALQEHTATAYAEAITGAHLSSRNTSNCFSQVNATSETPTGSAECASVLDTVSDKTVEDAVAEVDVPPHLLASH
ncbi:MAG: hypothetical protein HC767_06625 [Akkermansiaceae bacterium]|nr:hypothetical protein [Akkermansiaceae bacterium]